MNPFKRKKTEEPSEPNGHEGQPTKEAAPNPDTPPAQPEDAQTDQGAAPAPEPPQPAQGEEKAPENELQPSSTVAKAPESEPQPAPAPVETSAAPVEQPVVQPEPAKAPRQGLLYHLFSPQTRLGRVMRPVVRWLGAITGLFALGLLSGYLLLYQPTQRSLDAANARLASQNQTVVQKNETVQSLTAERDQAQNALKGVQDQLSAAASQNSLLLVMVDVANARVALTNKDGQTAKTAIAKAQADLTKATPYLESQDKTQTGLIQSRLNLIAQELASDPQATLSDLTKLASDLSALQQKLFPQ